MELIAGSRQRVQLPHSRCFRTTPPRERVVSACGREDARSRALDVTSGYFDHPMNNATGREGEEEKMKRRRRKRKRKADRKNVKKKIQEQKGKKRRKRNVGRRGKGTKKESKKEKKRKMKE